MHENGIRILRKHGLWLFAIFFSVTGALSLSSCALPGGKCTVPLDISKPIYEGTKVIAYEHGTAGCPIMVYANGPRVGQSNVSPVGYGEVYLDRALMEGETITAKQDDKGYPTWPQKSPKVEKVPNNLLINGEGFNPPLIISPIVACQKGIRVQGLVEGVRASVSGGLVFPPESPAHGSVWTPYESTFVGVGAGLKEADELVSWQDMETKFPRPSDYSTPPEAVQKLPDSLPVPDPIEDVGRDGVPDVLVGSGVLTFCDLFVGAELTVYSVDQQNNEHRVGGGIATDKCNWTPVEALKKDFKYCARQSLCKLESPKETKCVFPNNSINLPVIREPLCPDDTEVIVDQTAFGATVWIRVNGEDKGNASAFGSTAVINVSAGVPLKEGDEVAVRQNNTSLDSGWSNSFKVESRAKCEAIERPRGSESPPPQTEPICTPGKGILKLYRDESECQAGLIRAYTGAIPAIQNGSLSSITNNTSLWRVKIVDSHNLQGQGGEISCKNFGPRCFNVTPIAILEPGDSWTNIKVRTLDGGHNIYACLEPLTNTSSFPMTVDIEYEYQCLKQP